MKTMKRLGAGTVALLAAAAFTGAANAQNYPFAPQQYVPQGASPLVSEDQLSDLGCYPTGARNFQRGQIEYQCTDPYITQRIRPSGYGDGVRCSFAGAGDVIVLDDGRRGRATRWVCRENVQNYDHDDPRYGRDYRVVPANPYGNGGYYEAVPPSGGYYDQRSPRGEWRDDNWGTRQNNNGRRQRGPGFNK